MVPMVGRCAEGIGIDSVMIGSVVQTSTGGVFAMVGSVTQLDGLSQGMEGGRFSFRPEPSVGALGEPPSGAPMLLIHVTTPTSVTLSWAAGVVGFVLQESESLVHGAWRDLPSGGLNPVSLAVTSSPRFYRLIRR